MYQMKTTFWNDFEIANAFGIDAIKDTYKRAFNEWKTNVEYTTELCLVLNWHCWLCYEKQKTEMSELYAELYYQLRDYCLDNFKGENLQYFLKTID